MPSRTATLASSLLDAIRDYAGLEGSRGDASVHHLELRHFVASIGSALSRDEVKGSAQAALALVESADLLVIVSPIYRGSYSGLFKHFFDLIDPAALIDVPVVLAATGGSERHALVLEHALRPLFSFFRAITVPTSIYATAASIEGLELVGSELNHRVRLAARQAVALSSIPARARAGASEVPGEKPYVQAELRTAPQPNP